MTNVGFHKHPGYNGAVEVVVTSDDPRNRLIIANVVTDALRRQGFGNVDTLDSQTMHPLPETNVTSLMDRIEQKNPSFFHTPVTVWSAPDPQYIVRATMDSCGPYDDLERCSAFDELMPIYPDHSSLKQERVPPAPPIESLMTGMVVEPASPALHGVKVLVTYPPDRETEALEKIDEYQRRYKDLAFLIAPALAISDDRLNTANQKAAYQKGPKVLLSQQDEENVAAMKAGLDSFEAGVERVTVPRKKISDLPLDHPVRLMTEQALMESITQYCVGRF